MIQRLDAVASAIAIVSLVPILSACQASDTPSNAANVAQADGAASLNMANAATSSQKPSAIAFDAAKIGPGDFWTGKAITDGFGIACPFSADGGGRPDVAGASLGMTLQNAVSTLACRYPEAEFTTNGNENRNPYGSSGGAAYGLGVKFKPKDGRAYETLDLFLSGPRGKELIVGVWRVVYYRPENAPLIDKIAAQMTEKYGAFDQLSEQQGINARGAWTKASGQDGRIIPPGKDNLTCLRAINFGQLNYADDGSIDSAADARCGDTVTFRIGLNAGVGLAGDFVTFLFNPSFAKAQRALTDAEAQANSAARDAETQRQASQRQGPTL